MNFTHIWAFVKKAKIVQNRHKKQRNQIFCSLSLFWANFVFFFVHKCPNISKIQKVWINLNFWWFCAHFDVFMRKINFLPFVANLTDKQTNRGQNLATLSKNGLRLRLNVFCWYYHSYMHKNGYFLIFFVFSDFFGAK